MSVGIDTTRKQPVSAMPSPPRERGRPRTRGSETEFVLFIQGVRFHKILFFFSFNTILDDFLR